MKPIKIYAENLEDNVLEQFDSAMEQDFAVQGALMADAHLGYSLPIGAVVATKDVIVPSWVGYDIGCGMCALPTTFNAKEIKIHATQIFDKIYDLIPTGFNVHENPQPCVLRPDDLSELGRKAFDKRTGFRALGTLGGGNHFIEIGKAVEDAHVWIIIHSGSRGVGHGIATEYIRLASPDGKVREGHYGLRTDSPDGLAYINDLNWALDFALENRKRMMKKVIVAMLMYCAGGGEWSGLINRNHNHAEEKGGLWIHRKGATHAEKGMTGVIPGNMRDGSFIVTGLGDPESLWSSSHGAGRIMGRKQAKRELDTQEFIRTMHGITAKVGDSTLDESPGAYKDVFQVMRLQMGLVEVDHHIIPLINVKA